MEYARTLEPADAPVYPFAVPALRFAYDALEPFVDERTLRLHHDTLHQSCVDALNDAIKDTPALHGKSIEAILRNLDKVPEGIRNQVRTSGGGHANHQFLWKVIGPAGTRLAGPLLEAIEADFGSLATFEDAFKQAAAKHIGSGWAFLVLDPDSGRLEVMTLLGNNSVLTAGKLGLLVCDVWEHAYDLKYPNRRAEYVDAFWNIVDWNVVSARFASFRGEQRLS